MVKNSTKTVAPLWLAEGLVSSWRLTPYGLAFSLSTVRKDVPEQHDSARSFSLGQAVGHVRGKVLLESQLKAEGRQASPNLHYVKTQSVFFTETCRYPRLQCRWFGQMNRQGSRRSPRALEREVILGFPPNYPEQCINITKTVASLWLAKGLVASWGLTPYGLAFSLSTVRKDVPEQHDSARSFSLVHAIGHVRGKDLLESQLKA